MILGGLGLIVTGLCTSVADAPSALARPVAEGVSSLEYAPKPVYDDFSKLRVRFTTTGQARPGYEYYVSLGIDGPDARGSDCAWVAYSSLEGQSSRRGHIVGAPGKTITLWLLAEPLMGGYFCHGRAELSVHSLKIRGDAHGKYTRHMRSDKFRVLRAP